MVAVGIGQRSRQCTHAAILFLKKEGPPPRVKERGTNGCEFKGNYEKNGHSIINMIKLQYQVLG